jgi:hypothetical protein
VIYNTKGLSEAMAILSEKYALITSAAANLKALLPEKSSTSRWTLNLGPPTFVAISS